MHSAAQISNSFAVNEARLKNSARAAFGQIFQHHVLHLRRLERVQIQHAIDRELDGFIHKLNLLPISQMERIASHPLIGLKQFTAMRCTIQSMTLTDYDEVLRLWQNSEGVGLSESDTRAEIGSFLKRNRGLSFVAREGKQLVGAILCGHDGRRACLYHLAIAPSHRRNGLGTKLVRRCLAELKTASIPRCNVFFYAKNAAGERFWLKLGWKKRDDLCMAQRKVDSPRGKHGC
jgi:N-acetylglutamate synthase